jgi:hypothetical protein
MNRAAGQDRTTQLPLERPFSPLKKKSEAILFSIGLVLSY